MGDKIDLPENILRDYIPDVDKVKWIPDNNHNITYFTEDDIKRITNNYSTKLGKGAYGEVYKGVIGDNRFVAVKKFIRVDKLDEFAKEVIVHTQVNHKNVVRLVGCCKDNNAPMIVFEYAANGNLSDLLYCGDTPISLGTRLSIVIQCAEALGCMHSMYNPIVHYDFKLSNILVDENFHAKISDFGISRILSTDNTNSDFGISRILSTDNTNLTVNPTNMEKNVTRRFIQAPQKRKGAKELFDVDIAKESNMKILEGIWKIAKDCIKEDIDKRPEMNDVAARLRELRKTLELGGKRQNFSTALSKSSSSDVYLGDIDDNTRVAVKVFTNVSESREEFVLQLIIQSQVQHQNIVKLFGCCLEMDHPISVCEYVPNGALCNYLVVEKGEETGERSLLDMNTRHFIALGVANAIACLHEKWLDTLNGSITPWDILLDGNFCSKLSKPTPIIINESTIMTTEVVPGNYMYMAPERLFFSRGFITAKADVYSFGQLLLDIVFGIRDTMFWEELVGRKSFDFVNIVYQEVYLKQRIVDCLDPCIIQAEAYDSARSMATAEHMVKTALWCMQFSADHRPSMQKVVEMLQGTIDIDEPPNPSSSNLYDSASYSSCEPVMKMSFNYRHNLPYPSSDEGEFKLLRRMSDAKGLGAGARTELTFICI
uniref:Protein kinase domain containing protein n=3 Tax=Oryza sativa subsp. japonica TaxID=39947 RepID=Q8S5N5_ORYSJ|nr:Putative S-receptor kinase [Oryza sativa]AAP52072.1 Protein kinase domain containing protein [Oryza sativa Japonica Group]